MKIFRYLLFGVVLFSIAYLGFFHRQMPIVLFALYLLLGVLLYVWVLKPLLSVATIGYYIQTADYLSNYMIPGMIFYTWTNYTLVSNIKIASSQNSLVMLFLVTQIIVAVLMEVIAFIRLSDPGMPWPI